MYIKNRINILEQLKHSYKKKLDIIEKELNFLKEYSKIEKVCINDSLSERESEVAIKIKEGKSNKVIAEELYVTTNTVKRHCQKIYSKLGIKSRYELIKYNID
jgi:DNA-binding NarL/FixJ family response regulator